MTLRECPLCKQFIEMVPDGVFRSHQCAELANVQIEYLDQFNASGNAPPKIKLGEREIQTLMRGHCPDCAHPQFVGGPQGGLSQNIACPNCGAEFNFCSTAPSFSHRNGERGKPDNERLRTVFGIALVK